MIMEYENDGVGYLSMEINFRYVIVPASFNRPHLSWRFEFQQYSMAFLSVCGLFLVGEHGAKAEEVKYKVGKFMLPLIRGP